MQEDQKVKCEECEKQGIETFVKPLGLGAHMYKAHHITSQNPKKQKSTVKTEPVSTNKFVSTSDITVATVV